MNVIIFLLLFTRYFVVNSSSEIEKHVKTIHGNSDSIQGGKTFVLDADFENSPIKERSRRAVNSTIDPRLTKVKHLKDSHKQLMVHWVGEGSNVIICLARDPAPMPHVTPVTVNPSAVFISFDYGDTYENQTDKFKLANGSYATLEKFYNHPTFKSHFVFTDIRHNVIFVTKNHGKTIKRYELEFTPSEVSFYDNDSSVFIVLDKNATNHKLMVTEDYGEHFHVAGDYIKTFFWAKGNNDEIHLVAQRYEPNFRNFVLASNNFFREKRTSILASDVEEVFYKGDYIFFKATSDLQISYKMGERRTIKLDTNLPLNNVYVVDVTGNRIILAVGHSSTLCNLYTTTDEGSKDTIKFTLSLKDVFCYFPNTTWQDTWLHHISDEAFADVYKVEGVPGVYIASKVLTKPVTTNSLGPQHLGSVITFDSGVNWRELTPPQNDSLNQPIYCIKSENCSLHLSQKFSQLYPETRAVGISSSKSAPGVIIATGVLGRSLKGHYGVYVSIDAGQTWRQSLKDLHLFNMGDHGGIMTAVKYFKSQGETKQVLYSIDEGQTWNQTEFYDEEIRLYGLMTEPGENTTIFTMFGSFPDFHEWIIIKMDFMNVYGRTCEESDYKLWSPSQSGVKRSYYPCFMGSQITYKRRIPNAKCYNGFAVTAPVSKLPCECDYSDFECDYGFTRVGESPSRCILNETNAGGRLLEVPSSCEPGKYYLRTKGYRKIGGDNCVDGFESHYMPDTVPCPIQEMNDFLLFAQREKISRYNLVTNQAEELPVKNLKNVIAIDFDLRTDCVYWADIALDIIGRQCFKTGGPPEILVSSDLASIEGMALDWISNTLYFVDGIRAKIEFIRTDINHSGRMRRTVLDSKVLKKPRGIALHPQNGYMFWTDWNIETPSINRANLDGTNKITLFGKNVVEWPNGITVDYIANRVYWVDAKLDYIGSSDLHGDGFVKHIENKEVVSHPFAIAVFKEQMYWDDWKRNAIFTSQKENYRNRPVVGYLVKPLMGLMDLKVYAHGIQFGTNACTGDESCRYTCVGLPKNQSSCLCPDGLEMVNGTCLCPGGKTPSDHLSCSKVNSTCSPLHYTCANEECIPKGWRCDGENDCADNSDELQCGTQACPDNFFVCGDGKCLPHYWRCDYDVDCADGSDEKNCPRQNCTNNQFSCANGRCISLKWKCDGENDCRDGSDEHECSIGPPASCKSDEFHCKSGGIVCIPSTWKCDGEPDCRDSSDEQDCNNNTCLDYQFSCGPPNNRCIYNTWVCDGDQDCPDGRDEKNCGTIKPETVPPPIDHFTTKNGTCQDWMFMCQNKRCIPVWWKCDEADDCGDSSDEMDCPNSTTLAPFPNNPFVPTKKPAVCLFANQFQCSDGSCIQASWVCDGARDCLEGEDERNCDSNKRCTSDEFMCVADGSCIPDELVCNNHKDCPDGSDENCGFENMPGPATPSCSLGFFPCDGGTCLALSYMCDSKRDCIDGYDERNCSASKRVYQVMQMGVDQHGLNQTSLLLYWWIQSPTNLTLQFMPSISKVGENNWTNKSVTYDNEFQFGQLEPYTEYNMTVYVKIRGNSWFPPAKYFIANTIEDVPTEPWNLKVTQLNFSHILLSWNSPVHPNGKIESYEIGWSQDDENYVTVETDSNKTQYMMTANFDHDGQYKFYVIARNSKYPSAKSNIVTFTYDGESDLKKVTNLKVKDSTNISVTLTWNYDYSMDGFEIRYGTTDRPYPLVKTSQTTATLKLAPDEKYTISVTPFKKSFKGPPNNITFATVGIKLPEVTNVVALLNKTVGTSVKLSWDRPKDSRKVQWTYGVYYTTALEEFFKGSVLEYSLSTTNESALIENLQACEKYGFTVGIVGPYGYGRLNHKIATVVTYSNPLAPPKALTVTSAPNMTILVQWKPSCYMETNNSYMVEIEESHTHQTWHNRIIGFSHTFKVSYGGVYKIRVRNFLDSHTSKSHFTEPVTYEAPHLLAPYEVQVFPKSNGSYIVFWKERQLPQIMGGYRYEVLVSEGNIMNEKTAERFPINKPPFIYTNSSGNMYTFAVRIRTDKGMISMTSEYVSKRNTFVSIAESSNYGTIIVSVLIILALSCVVVFLFVRNRKLRSSFKRFTNSHYDTRSQAATFDDNGLEDEDCPQIRDRFSDDEPLVIA